MLGINLIKWMFAFQAITIAITSLFINYFERFLPAAVPKMFRHGKFSSTIRMPSLEKLEVPKSWFRHFYVFAGPLGFISLLLMIHRYYFNDKLPHMVVNILTFWMGKPLLSLVPPENAILGMALFTTHCCKRYYESHYISVYSNVTMSITIFLVGLNHYFGTILSLIGETSDLVTDKKIILDWTRLTWVDYTFVVVFLLFTTMQLRTNLILANLRKDTKGVVVTRGYKIPHGELFEYVTAPLQLTEICVYISLSVILRSAVTYHFVTVWVIFNQMECAYLTHEWSLKTLKNYPKSRKIMIPFIW